MSEAYMSECISKCSSVAGISYIIRNYKVPFSDYSSAPLIRTPHLPKILSLLERCPLVKGSTTYIHSSFGLKYVSFIEGCPF